MPKSLWPRRDGPGPSASHFTTLLFGSGGRRFRFRGGDALMGLFRNTERPLKFRAGLWSRLPKSTTDVLGDLEHPV